MYVDSIMSHGKRVLRAISDISNGNQTQLDKREKMHVSDAQKANRKTFKLF